MLKLFQFEKSPNGSRSRPANGLSHLSEAELASRVDTDKLPRHIAVIMDGNGRWARRRGLPRIAGHREGINTLREQTSLCGELGVEALTVYAFSTENWDRPKDEVDSLFGLLDEALDSQVEELHQNGVRLRVLGRREGLSKRLVAKIRQAEQLTCQNEGLALNISFNYGGRAEIVDTIKEIAVMAQQGVISVDQIDEALVANLLYTAELPDPDLLIRTGGECRLSNFLLWQTAYAEIWFCPVFWPDFKRRHLLEALVDYQRRERRFGRV